MTTVELANSKSELASRAKDAATAPVILTRHGKPYAVILSLKGVDAESLALSTNPKFIAMLNRSRLRLETEGGISPSEMRRRLGLKAPPRRKAG